LFSALGKKLSLRLIWTLNQKINPKQAPSRSAYPIGVYTICDKKPTQKAQTKNQRNVSCRKNDKKRKMGVGFASA
jgi:hypothetical protein